MTRVTAAVCRAGGDLFGVEELVIDDPRPDEVLVRFTAAGLCHTDLEVAAGRMPTPFPVVAGHEGAGVVDAVGSAVSGFAPGDRVVASFSFCGTCRNCRNGRPAYCPQHFPLNFGAQRTDGSTGLRDATGEPVHDHFFGQSSFAGYGLCRPSSLVRVSGSALVDHVLAPLGCGVITGAGAVWNLLRVPPGSTVAVFGAGAVGLSAVMAAFERGDGGGGGRCGADHRVRHPARAARSGRPPRPPLTGRLVRWWSIWRRRMTKMPTRWCACGY